MILIKRDRQKGIRVSCPQVRSEDAKVIEYALMSCAYLVPLGGQVTGKELAETIRSDFEGVRMHAVAEVLERCDAIQPHFVGVETAPLKDGQCHVATGVEARRKLVEKVMTFFSVFGGRGFPFSYKNDHGLTEIGIVFGESGEQAYGTIHSLDSVDVPSERDVRLNGFIHAGMTSAQMMISLQEEFSVVNMYNHA